MTQISSATVESPAATPAPSGSAPDAPVAEAFASLLAGVPAPVDPAVVAAAPAADGAEPEPLGGRVDPIPPAQAFREQARGSVLTGATRPIGVPADATSLPLRPPLPTTEGEPAVPATAPSPSLPIGLGVAGAEVRGDALGASPLPTVASAARLADVLQAATRGPEVPVALAERAATPPPATVAGRAQVAADGSAPAQAAPASPTTPAFAPANAPAAPAPARADMPLPTRTVGLEHAVETVRLALRHGAERGVSHARISLAPRELGGIDVHLRHTPDGLVARVVAEHASAVQQLQQAGAELRRSLEQQGVTLLRLDVGASGGETAGRRGAATAFGQDDRGRRRGETATPLDGATETTAVETTTTLQLPNGALIDVLA